MAGMTAEAVYVLLNNKIVLLTEEVKQMEGWEPLEHKGTVQTAENLPTDAKKGWMYNIATDSAYGAAGMNVVMTADGWDPMGPIINMKLYLSKEEAEEFYQSKGDYPTKTEVKEGYQPKGDYATKAEVKEGYQPKGNYVTKETADETYQPSGEYLTEEKAAEAYQPKGNYLTNIPLATGSVIGGIKADQKTDKETVPAKIDPETGKMYVPELPGTDDLSKEATAQQILTKLQALTPLIQELASSGIANSVNGFSFIYGTDGSVTMTYTPDGATEAEMAVLPTGSTQAKIAQATGEIVNSLKIIAGKEDKTA